MADGIIVILLVLVIVLALRSSLKHFRGEGGCCGGGGGVRSEDLPEKTLEGKKLGEKIVLISGMHCDHCAASVTEAINRIEGASAKVSLKKKRAVVSYDRELSDDELKKAVEAAGFQVTSIGG